MKTILATVFLSGTMALAQSGPMPGYHYWSHDDLNKMTNDLAPQAQTNEYKFKSQTIVNEGNHRFLVTHREAPGESEYHDKESDIVYVQSGHATLIFGGKMIGAATTAPGELRGTGIEGGQQQLLSPGDVVVVPIKTPHQFKLLPGEVFNYFVVKVTDQSAVAH